MSHDHEPTLTEEEMPQVQVVGVTVNDPHGPELQFYALVNDPNLGAAITRALKEGKSLTLDPVSMSVREYHQLHGDSRVADFMRTP